MKIVGYYRSFAEKPGDLSAQQEVVRAFARQQDATIVGQYSEFATGQSADRPVLRKAFAHASRAKATIVVATLDRLSRNFRSAMDLMQSGVNVVACEL